jgi:hypothetical protein
MPSGCSARNAATCSGRKRWWTEQCPFHSSVASQVLVGEEQHLITPLRIEGPGQDGAGIGRRAHGPTLAAHEGLQGSRGVHVGDGHDAGHVHYPPELFPGLLHLRNVSHVSHGAAGIEIGQHHLLMVARQHIGRLGHEVDAAEDDEFRLRLR